MAFEMAQQLHEQGQKVALLALFDSYAIDSSKSMPLNIHEHLSYFLQLRLKKKLSYMLQRIKGRTVNTIKSKIYLITSKLYLNDERSLPQVSPDNPLVRELFFNKALSQYVPQVYPGRVTLFRTRKGVVTWHHDPKFGWGELAAGGLEIHDIPGWHFDIAGWHTNFLREPDVQVLAEKLRACLDKA